MLVILNPHISDFLSEPISFRLIGRRPLKKYGYLITEEIKKYGKVNVLVNAAVSGIIPMQLFLLMPYFLRLIFTKIEIYYWKKINNFGKEVEVNYNKNIYNPSSVLLFFSYKNYKSSKRLIKTCAYFKNNIVHISHYHLDTLKLSNLLSAIPNLYIAADTIINDAPLFKHFFSWYNKKNILLQFEVSPRFKLNIDFKNRTNKIISTGTFHNFKDKNGNPINNYVKDYVNFTGASALHPLRKNIFDHKNLYYDYIDCYNSEFLGQQNFFKKLIPANLLAKQATYFSFDIVEEYNKHIFAIVGEEYFNSLPGVGAFEAMACGCILIGHPSCYIGIQLQPHVDYIPHNNNIDEIIESIKKLNLTQLSDNAIKRSKNIAHYFSASENYLRFINQTQTLN